MSTLTLILGGARSGKSSYALKLAKESGNPVTFIATAQAFDNEMSARIQKHKTERPTEWSTLELPMNLAQTHRQNPFGGRHPRLRDLAGDQPDDAIRQRRPC
ncbi:bifunctional adenosylcobinamide kinase/adenosylcobinamide-phosphate guanylyltransferase [Candidatus Villigracilis affinis]|uniref:bifunctional adenosylcobinamide kinase/adenosylcobinamide-phosphate guanylyltransferase n=1 Tax=Candidatus Villigracilis affinis TaxID=3140682 RepID=UPI001D704D3B|nr:bifunctional adenosylcobinamide kinase/adenosylcobinamide-phosphate guanylyltransferase [Anaerolineales bacterium]